MCDKSYDRCFNEQQREYFKNLVTKRVNTSEAPEIPYNKSYCCSYGEHRNFENDMKSVQNVMSLQVNHGGDIHRILVEGEKGSCLLLCDVMKQIEKELKIPADKQRIFHKGIELQKFASTDLEALGVYQNSILRVTGESCNENWIEKFIHFH